MTYAEITEKAGRHFDEDVWPLVTFWSRLNNNVTPATRAAARRWFVFGWAAAYVRLEKGELQHDSNTVRNADGDGKAAPGPKAQGPNPDAPGTV